MNDDVQSENKSELDRLKYQVGEQEQTIKAAQSRLLVYSEQAQISDKKAKNSMDRAEVTEALHNRTQELLEMLILSLLDGEVPPRKLRQVLSVVSIKARTEILAHKKWPKEEAI